MCFQCSSYFGLGAGLVGAVLVRMSRSIGSDDWGAGPGARGGEERAGKGETSYWSE